MGAYHLAKKPGSQMNSNFPENPFRNCRLPPEVVLFFLSKTERWEFPYHLANFPVASLSLGETNYEKSSCNLVSAISFGWFADFGKNRTIIQRSSQSVYFDKW